LHRSIPGSAILSFNGGHLFFLFRQRQEVLDSIERFLS